MIHPPTSQAVEPVVSPIVSSDATVDPFATLSSFPETADIGASTEDYARRFVGKAGEWLLQVQETGTLQLLKPYPGARILDVGGGHGQLAGPLVREGHHVTVLGSAEICKARVQPLIDRGQCDFKVGNILDLPYTDQAFDVVVSYRLLAHVTEWQQYLSELTRVARYAVIIDYPSTSSLNYIAPRLFKLKQGLEKNTRTFTTYNDVDVRSAFKSFGFGRMAEYRQFFLPMVIHRALKQPALSAAIESGFRKVGLTDRYGSPVILRVTR